MPSEPAFTFDRVSLHFIERHWWEEDVPKSLRDLIWEFLAPETGRAWFRGNEGPWTEVKTESADAVKESLQEILSIWVEYQDVGPNTWEVLRGKGLGRCAMIVDARRFRACVHRLDPNGSANSLSDREKEMPGEFFVGFEPDWSFNPGTGTLLTPHFRVSNGWPVSEQWAPPQAIPHPPEALDAVEACERLEDIFWYRVETEFREAKRSKGLYRALIDLGDKSQDPPVFYYASPTRRLGDADAYLEGEHLEALNKLGARLLASPDMRSIEISGGVMEGALAVFNHSPRVEADYCLFFPLAGFDEGEIERKIQFITYGWHEIDFDATWKIYELNQQLGVDEAFSSIWLDSVEKVLGLNSSLSSLLGKKEIQDRMFELAHLVGGFLAKLQARTYAGALKRNKLQRDMESAIEASKQLARTRFTLRGITGLGLMGNISDGQTRVYQEFQERIGIRTERAHELAQQIENIGKSLRHMAGLEEQERERAMARSRQREEETSKLLNRVLALVAVLAAIPLLVGQYDTTSLADALRWLPFGMAEPDSFWRFGLHFSFWAALLAFALTMWALSKTLRRNTSGEEKREEILEKTEKRSEALFDFYRGYESDAVQGLVHRVIRPDVVNGGRFWESASTEAKEARERLHDFDREMARTLVKAIDQCKDWDPAPPTPTTDWDGYSPNPVPNSPEAWARDMEGRICSFVLGRDVFDLRPEKLNLPITLSLYRFKYGRTRTVVNPVSDWEFELALKSFGFSEDEIEIAEEWAGMPEVAEMTPLQFIDACMEVGITALHPMDLTE